MNSGRKSLVPLYSFFFSMLIQVISFALGLALKDYLGWPYFLFVHAFVAFVLARLLRLSLPWQLFNLCLPLGAFVFFSLSVPPLLITVALVLLLLIYIPTFWTRVPYYPTSRKMYDVVLKQIPEDEQICFLDLGSGFGTMLIYLAKNRPNCSFVGVEISPLPYFISCLKRILTRSSNVKFSMQNFWKLSLEPHDYVYAFLAPGPMEAVWNKVKEEMKPNSVFMTNSFNVPEKPDYQEQVDDHRQCVLYVFRI